MPVPGIFATMLAEKKRRGAPSHETEERFPIDTLVNL